MLTRQDFGKISDITVMTEQNNHHKLAGDKTVAEYYVTMTDTFFSSWTAAKGQTNKLIFICEDYQEALIVADNANARNDQKYVNICRSKPSYYRSTYGPDYVCGDRYVQIKTKEDYPNWYKMNAF